MSIKILVGEKLHSIHEINFCSEDNYFRYLVLLFVCRTTFETYTTRYQCRMIWQDFHKAYQKHLGQQQLCKKVKQFYMILQKQLILKRRLILSYFAVFEIVTVRAPNKVGLHDSKMQSLPKLIEQLQKYQWMSRDLTKLQHIDLPNFWMILQISCHSDLSNLIGNFRIFPHSDFTWNKSWSFWSPKSAIFDHLCSSKLTLLSVNFFQKSKFRASKIIKMDFT